LRASVAAAVVARSSRSSLARGVAELRQTVATRGAEARDFEALLSH
jgi:hypothetical protein